MDGLTALGKVLLILGGATALLGAALLAAGRLPWLHLGRLPGDIALQRGAWRFYFPVATSLLLSALLTLLFWLLGRR